MIDQEIVNDRQGSVNKRQSVINDDQTIINEQTKISLHPQAFWSIIVFVVSLVVLWFTTISGIRRDMSDMKNDLKLNNQKIDMVIANQVDQTKEFREWKTQAETRLGTVESNQNTVISYVENHLGVKIR